MGSTRIFHFTCSYQHVIFPAVPAMITVGADFSVSLLSLLLLLMMSPLRVDSRSGTSGKMVQLFTALLSPLSAWLVYFCGL